MRLTPEEVKKIILAINQFLPKSSAELRLFGSRVNDLRKGGDIDLLLLVAEDTIKTQLIMQKHLLLASIKELIGDQKIDFRIALFSEIDQDHFLQIIYPDSICLKKWSSSSS